MKFLSFIFLSLLLFSCNDQRAEKASLLDSLLYIPNEAELVKHYGAEHVQTISNLHGNGQGNFALLFPGTSVQVVCRWNHRVNNRTNKGQRRVTISLEHAEKSAPGNIKRWTTKAGIVTGMTLKELEQLIGEFKITVNKVARKKITTVYKHESDTTIYTIFFDPELKFTRKILKLEPFYSSKLPELQDENPEIHAVELEKEFLLPKEILENESDSVRVQ